MEVREGPVDDPNVLAHLVLDPDLGGLGLDLLLNRLDLFLLQGHRLVARADEAGNAGRVTHDVPRLVGHDHVDQDVAGEGSLGHVTPLAVLDLDHVLGGDQDLKDPVVHVHRVDALHQVVAHLVLVTGIGVNDIPVGLTLGSLDAGWAGTLEGCDCDRGRRHLGRGRMSLANPNPLAAPDAAGLSRFLGGSDAAAARLGLRG